MSEEIVSQGIVLYTDGGCSMPPSGCGGYGVHGYIYSFSPRKKGTGNPRFIATKESYLLKNVVKDDDGSDIVVNGYYDVVGTMGKGVTNNIAELLALKRAIEITLELITAGQKIIKVVFHMDSEYVRKGITEWIQLWAKRDWKRPDTTEVANKAIWQELAELKKTLGEACPSVSYLRVAAHQAVNEELGNNTADRLATIGKQFSWTCPPSEDLRVSPPDGYWGYEAQQNSLLSYKYCYFTTQDTAITPGEYFVGNQNFEPTLLGQQSTDNSFGIVVLKKPDEILESVRKRCLELSGGFSKITMVRLEELYSASTHRDLSRYGLRILSQVMDTRLDLFAPDDEPVTREFNPPLISRFGIESLNRLNGRLKQYLSNDPCLVVTDITSTSLYKTEEKVSKKGEITKATTLVSELIVGISKITVTARYKKPDGSIAEAIVPLMFGVDIPTRNCMKRLETLNPVVKLITWTEADNAFRCATIIETGEDVSIWACVDSNLRII